MQFSPYVLGWFKSFLLFSPSNTSEGRDGPWALMDQSACWCWCTSGNARSRCSNLLRTVFPNSESAIQQPLRSVLVNDATAGRENPAPSHPLPPASTPHQDWPLTSNQPFFLDSFSAETVPQVTPKQEKGMLGGGFSPFRLVQSRHWTCSEVFFTLI